MKAPLRFAAASFVAITACAASSAHADERPPLPPGSTIAPTFATPSTSRPTSSEPVRLVIIQPQPGLASAPASAPMDPLPPPAVAPQPKTRRRWYGWQPLIADGAGIALLGLGIGFKSFGLAYAAAVPYLLGGPIVHLAHGRPGAAAGSLALRAGIPLAFGYGAYLLLNKSDPLDFDNNLVVALLVGMAGWLGANMAIALDAAVLSRETVAVEPKERSSFRLVPQLAVDPKGARFGLGGTF